MFNEETYKSCIGHLISQKNITIIIYTIVFAILFAIIGTILSIAIYHEFSLTSLIIGGIVGCAIGYALGIYSTWKIEMKIQEAYWKIDMLNETKKNNTKATIAPSVTPTSSTETPKIEMKKINHTV